MSLDEMYGIDIGDYAKAHGVTVDDLIRKTQIDVELLRQNYLYYANIPKNELTDKQMITAGKINKLIEKKRAHIERLEHWKNKSRPFANLSSD